MKYGSYPVSLGVLEWVSQRLDAVDYSSYCYWYERRKLIKLADDVSDGLISRHAAQRVLNAYNRDSNVELSLEELWDLDDTYIFAPANDWIVYTNDIRRLLREAEEKPHVGALEALADGRGVDWVLLYQTGEHLLHALKTPYSGLLAVNKSADQFAHALVPGTELSFVLPPEVHGIIKQENEYASR